MNYIYSAKSLVPYSAVLSCATLGWCWQIKALNLIPRSHYSPFTLGSVVTRTALTRDGTVVLTKIFSVHTMKNEHASSVSNCRILLTTPISMAIIIIIIKVISFVTHTWRQTDMAKHSAAFFYSLSEPDTSPDAI